MLNISPMDAWNPGQYRRFENERSQPFWDLVAMTPGSALSLLDIGCGTGELTRDLHLKHPARDTLGIDSSGKMLADAPSAPGLAFQLARVEEFKPQKQYEIVFSNAALQWVEDHAALFAKIFTWVAPGGCLAVQMPVNFDHPSHSLSIEMAERYGLTARKPPVLTPEEYARLLHGVGGENVRVYMNVYLHPMKDSLEVVEWTKGTLLTHYEKQMTSEHYAQFLREYSDELVARLGRGPYLYTFKRLFVAATNPKR